MLLTEYTKNSLRDTPVLLNVTLAFKTDSCSRCFFSSIASFLERTTSSWYSAIVFSTSRKICSAATASCSLTSSLSSCIPAMMEHQLPERWCAEGLAARCRVTVDGSTFESTLTSAAMLGVRYSSAPCCPGCITLHWRNIKQPKVDVTPTKKYTSHQTHKLQKKNPHYDKIITPTNLLKYSFNT